MKRILCIFGTRPEVIKIAPLVHALSHCAGVELLTCDTGQHKEMAAPLLDWFEIRPDRQLSLMTHNQGLSHFMAQSLMKIDDLLVESRPDVVICQGDTTTAAAAGIAAFHRKIPLAHVEAGLRTGNRNAPWPEEFNRRIIDLISDYYFAPTTSSQEALLAENVPASQIWVTGNTAVDALYWTLGKIAKSGPFPIHSWGENLQPLTAAGEQHRPFVLVTAHRRESFGSGMQNISLALSKLASRFPDIDWVFPVHLNPNVSEVMHSTLDQIPNIRLSEPLDYPRFCWLLSRCLLVLTDSGGLQEEAPALGKPVLVMRDVTERPEGIQQGAAKLVGCTVEKIVGETSRLLTDQRAFQNMSLKKSLYGDGLAAKRIAKVLAD